MAMNLNAPMDPRQELEAKITALLLGELPEPEATALNEALAKDPELAKLRQRLEQTIGLVRETVTLPAMETKAEAPPLRLSAERRERLLQQFKTVRPKGFAKPRQWWWNSPALAAAAVLIAAGLVTVLLPRIFESRSRSQFAYERELPAFKRWSVDEDKTQREPLAAGDSTKLTAAYGGLSHGDAGSFPVDSSKYLFFTNVHGGRASSPEIQAKETFVAGLALGARDSKSGVVEVDRPDREETHSLSYLTNALASESALPPTLNGASPSNIVLPAGAPVAQAPTAEMPPLGLAEPDVTVAPVQPKIADRIAASGVLALALGASKAKDTLASSAMDRLAEAPADGRLLQENKVQSTDTFAQALHDNRTRQPQELALADAERDLREQRRFADVLQMKIYSEKADLSEPKTSMVEIVDNAVPSAHPKTSLWGALGLGGAGEYESKARIRMERDQSDIGGIRKPQTNMSYDPYFVQTEFEVIQSQPVLDRVVKDLNLAEVWAKKQGKTKLGPAETRELLKKSLDLKTVKGAELIEIGAKSDDPNESATIANAVAQSYRQYRLSQRGQLAESEMAALQTRFAQQTARVHAMQADVDQLRKQVEAAKKEPDDMPARPSHPAPIPPPEVLVSENAFSTFSLNVSDVSFKLAAASLEKGALPEPGSIRSEEFINAFDYRDPEPVAGAPMTFAWERARYPFAQNRDVVRFSLKTAAQGRQVGKPMNLVLLLDKSGSMERADRVEIIRHALRELAGQLHAQDKLSVVTFARTARLAADGVPGDQAGKVAEEVAAQTPDGGTNLEEAMKLAYETARRHYLADGINRVVLLTDGAANLGNINPESLQQQVESNRKQGVALDCFGVGWEGYNDDLLEVLTRHGDGRYGFLNDPEAATTQFAGQLAGALRVAAADVKVQVEFNPTRVKAYRQIGYAKHQLTKEQFRDNTVDAAELGAAESGTALYVIEVNPSGLGALATVRVRYKIPGTSDYREQEWTVPYQGSAPALDQAKPSLRLAVTASAFSEWLASSPYATEVTPDRLLSYMHGVCDLYGADKRPKALETMIRQSKAIGK